MLRNEFATTCVDCKADVPPRQGWIYNHDHGDDWKGLCEACRKAGRPHMVRVRAVVTPPVKEPAL